MKKNIFAMFAVALVSAVTLPVSMVSACYGGSDGMKGGIPTNCGEVGHSVTHSYGESQGTSHEESYGEPYGESYSYGESYGSDTPYKQCQITDCISVGYSDYDGTQPPTDGITVDDLGDAGEENTKE